MLIITLVSAVIGLILVLPAFMAYILSGVMVLGSVIFAHYLCASVMCSRNMTVSKPPQPSSAARNDPELGLEMTKTDGGNDSEVAVGMIQVDQQPLGEESSASPKKEEKKKKKKKKKQGGDDHSEDPKK